MSSSTLRKEYLAALGLETWTLRGPAAAASEPVAAPFNESAPVVAAVPREAARRDEVAPGDAAAPREAAYDWPQLRERVAACTRCGLSATRTQTVFGVGNLQAEWLVVGEAPGAEEDRQGEPFVGRAARGCL